MRLGEIDATSSRRTGLKAGAADVEPAARASESRALVALSPAACGHQMAANYRQAPFLAHLIAMKNRHPQTRERRRAEPDEALAAYRNAAALTKWL